MSHEENTPSSSTDGAELLPISLGLLKLNYVLLSLSVIPVLSWLILFVAWTHIRRSKNAEGTWLASHFAWQKNSLLIAIVLIIVVTIYRQILADLIGWEFLLDFVNYYYPLIAIWFIYRMVKGLTLLNRSQIIGSSPTLATPTATEPLSTETTNTATNTITNDHPIADAISSNIAHAVAPDEFPTTRLALLSLLFFMNTLIWIQMFSGDYSGSNSHMVLVNFMILLGFNITSIPIYIYLMVSTHNALQKLSDQQLSERKKFWLGLTIFLIPSCMVIANLFTLAM